MKSLSLAVVTAGLSLFIMAAGFPGDMILSDMNPKSAMIVAPSESVGVTPCTMPTNAYWDYDAANLSEADGVSISTWANAGSYGSGMDLTATGTTRPVMDTVDPQLGIPAAVFDGAQFQIMRSGYLSPRESWPLTACYVVELDDINTTAQVYFDGRSNGYRIYDGTNYSGSDYRSLVGWNAASTVVYKYNDGPTDNSTPYWDSSGKHRWNWGCYTFDSTNSRGYFNDQATEVGAATANDLDGFALGGRTLGASFITGRVTKFSLYKEALSAADLKTRAECFEETYVGQSCTYPAGSPCRNGHVCHVAVVGDSIDTQATTGSFPGRGWYQLEWRTDIGEGTASSKAHCLNLENYAVGGYTTSQILTNVNTYVVGHNFDLVVVGGGINDIGASVPQATIKANLDSIVSAITSDGGKVWYRETLPYTAYSDANIEDLNTHMAGKSDVHILTDGSGTRLHDVAESSPGSNVLKTAWDSGDGLHPNSTGANDIAGYLTAQVGPL